MAEHRPPDTGGDAEGIDDDVTTPADSDLLAEIRRRHGLGDRQSARAAAAADDSDRRVDAGQRARDEDSGATPATDGDDGDDGDGGAGTWDDGDDDETVGADSDLIAQIRREAAATQVTRSDPDSREHALSSSPDRSTSTTPTRSGSESGKGVAQPHVPPPGSVPPTSSPSPAPSSAARPSARSLPPPPPAFPSAAPVPSGQPSPRAPDVPRATPPAASASRRWTPPPRLPAATGSPATGDTPGRSRGWLPFVAGIVAALVVAAAVYVFVLRDSSGDDDVPSDPADPADVADLTDDDTGDGSDDDSSDSGTGDADPGDEDSADGDPDDRDDGDEGDGP